MTLETVTLETNVQAKRAVVRIVRIRASSDVFRVAPFSLHVN
jgi:hypothetical protein